MSNPPRPLSQRKTDTLYRLEHDKDAWIATADAKGNPYLVPLSFWWDRKSLFVSTVLKNQTAKNIIETGNVRISLGHTRDVVIIAAHASEQKNVEICGNEFSEKCGWDPREAKGYLFFRLDPYHIEAWREKNEHADRFLMQNSKWLA